MIYDCFTFFNELDLLEIRLGVLGDLVDYFVLVEASQTFQGQPKRLYFAENRQRFREFDRKIIHVVVDKFPSDAIIPFHREAHQRNRIVEGLRDASHGDIVLISDVDEIPDPETVRSRIHAPGPVVFRQLLFYYYLNSLALRPDGAEGKRQNATVMFTYNGSMPSPQSYRSLVHLRGWRGDTVAGRARGAAVRCLRPLPRRVHFADNGGWHFSFLGGVEAIIDKIEAFSHPEFNSDSFKAVDRISGVMQRGEDLFGRDQRFGLVDVDRLPGWLRENLHRYAHLLAAADDGRIYGGRV